ncbi:MAG: hypothetical protein ACRDRQ_03135 [Pseudonocardiaceae bacterium]
MPSKAGLSKHAAVDRLRSYARGRNERLSTTAAKSSRTTCARPWSPPLRSAAPQAQLLDHPGLRFLLQLRELTLQTMWRVIRDGAELVCVHARDGAWAEANITARRGQHALTQGGPRHIWDQIEHITALWSQLGQPSADRFGLTVTTDQQWLWLDTPESHRLVAVCDATRAGW